MVGNAQDLLGRMFLNGCKWSQKHFYLQISSVDDQISGIDGIYSYIYIYCLQEWVLRYLQFCYLQGWDDMEALSFG